MLKTSELKNDYIQTLPDFYRQIVYSFIQIRSLTVQKPATSDDLANEPLWHNKFITMKIRMRECTLYLRNWIKSGILYVKDLQFTNGKVDETFIFEVVKQKSNLLIETLKVKSALNSYKNILQQIPLNVRSLDKQDLVEIKEWPTKKLTVIQVQHNGIESSFHIFKTVLPHITHE